MSTYEIPIVESFPNQRVDLLKLEMEIRQSTVSKTLSDISCQGNTCTIVFQTALSETDLATLMSVIAGHDGYALPHETPLINTIGAQVVALNYPEIEERHIWDSHKIVSVPGETVMLDIELDREIRLQGGDFQVVKLTDVHEDDYLEFSVVDKNDVLGLFSTYGLVVGQDILELSKFVRNQPLVKGKERLVNASATTSLVRRGLFLRVGITSHGTIPFSTWITYYAYQV